MGDPRERGQGGQSTSDKHSNRRLLLGGAVLAAVNVVAFVGDRKLNQLTKQIDAAIAQQFPDVLDYDPRCEDGKSSFRGGRGPGPGTSVSARKCDIGPAKIPASQEAITNYEKRDDARTNMFYKSPGGWFAQAAVQVGVAVDITVGLAATVVGLGKFVEPTIPQGSSGQNPPAEIPSTS